MPIKWIGGKVLCYNPGLKNRNHDFYKACDINGVVYNLHEYAFINCTSNPNALKVGKLLCLYESHESWHKNHKYRGTVRWYTWARDLESQYIPYCVELDMKNEVIEDLRATDIFISLDSIRGKCDVIFVAEEDTVPYVSNVGKNGIDLVLSCRYTIGLPTNELRPLISLENCTEGSRKMFEGLSLSPNAKRIFEGTPAASPEKTNNKRNSSSLVGDCETNKSIQKPSSPSKSRKLSEGHECATRDSDGSFHTSQPSLNYSIVDQSNESLKIKLKLSKTQDEKDKVETKERRKSTRISRRISYNDKVYNKDYIERNNRAKNVNLDLFNVKNLQVVVEDITNTEIAKKVLARSSTESDSEEESDLGSDQKYSLRSTRSSVSRTKAAAAVATRRSTRNSVTSRPTKYNECTSDDGSPIAKERKTVGKKRLLSLLPSSRRTSTSTPIKDSFASPKVPNSKVTATPKSGKKDTPAARARLIRAGLITPSVQSREKEIVKDCTPLGKAKSQLHVAYIPTSLPCREDEFSDIFNFVRGKLLDGCGGCMYISGVPGTGKTATVTEVISCLEDEVDYGQLPKFVYVNVNGMKLSEPRYAYVEIHKQLTKQTLPWEQAQNALEERITKSKKTTPIVLVVDELDILCTKRQDVVYNLLDWPTKSKTQLIVITIANTMNLPERLLMGRVTSRLGLTRLTFQAYTHKQLQEIVTKRLMGTNTFNPDAIQLVARKVASVSGDARRALDICRRSAEVAQAEGKDTVVSMKHVNTALNAMITQPKVQAVRKCSQLEKLILRSVVSEVERTGVEEVTFSSVFMMLITVAGLHGFPLPSVTVVSLAVSRLGACRLLLVDSQCSNIDRKILLNVSADDVYYALDTEL